MARKIEVIEPSGQRYHTSKVIAALLVRRALADWVVEHVSLKLRPLEAFPYAEKFVPERIPDEEFYYCRRALPPINPGVKEKLVRPAAHRQALISAARCFAERPETVGPLIEQTEFL